METTNLEKTLKKCDKMFRDLQNTYDLSEHSDSVERLRKTIKKELSGGDKITEKTVAKKRKSWKTELLDSAKAIFDKYSALEKLPVYAWGRYYKYECSGDAFDSDDATYSDLAYYYDIDCKFNEKLLEEIDEEIVNGTSIGGINLPSRRTIASAYGFDDRGGMCLVVEKKDGKLILEAYNCGSPE